MYTVAALYHFTSIADAPAMRLELKAALAQLGVIGILLVAPEGINGTLAGTPEAIQKMVALLHEKLGLPLADVKYSTSNDPPFGKLRVRLKKEILTFNQPAADPTQRVGEYVSAKEWDALLADPDVLLLDTRNDYEVALGRFKNAHDPNIKTFTEFADYVRAHMADYKNKKIAMYCTGGIRCEKASAFMLAEGFPQVYHLKGGILKYLEEVPAAQSSWEGTCFVFDRRVGLEHGLVELEDAVKAEQI